MLSLSGLLLRFLLGGAAVAGSALIGRRLGGRIGGIFAAFPAVYTSAIISTVLAARSSSETVTDVFQISSGALVGMTINISCAIATAWLVGHYGWRRGLLLSISGWLVVATAVFVSGAHLGWLR